VKLTPNEVIHLKQALFFVKDMLGDEPGDKEKREMHQRLYKKFDELSKS